jgi:hypothetical protein
MSTRVSSEIPGKFFNALFLLRSYYLKIIVFPQNKYFQDFASFLPHFFGNI